MTGRPETCKVPKLCASSHSLRLQLLDRNLLCCNGSHVLRNENSLNGRYRIIDVFFEDSELSIWLNVKQVRLDERFPRVLYSIFRRADRHQECCQASVTRRNLTVTQSFMSLALLGSPSFVCDPCILMHGWSLLFFSSKVVAEQRWYVVCTLCPD